MPNRPRIMVADGSKYFALSTWQMLIPEDEFDFVGLANSTAEALEMARLLGPEIILVDISHSETGGFQTVRDLSAVRPEAAIVVVGLAVTTAVDRVARQAGASACLDKSELAEKLPGVLSCLAKKYSTYSISSRPNQYSLQWTGVRTDVSSH
ncbi:MAG: DNA-binding response regulator [Chloroflexi bacterium]|nr:MAG: DNA-binding response regulator [Chloroflexota bacterium]